MDRDIDLDALFAEAAEVSAEPSAALMARILTDAGREQPKPNPLARLEKPASTAPARGGVFGWVTGFADVLGGSRGLAGLSLAGLTGLYLGLAQPSGLASVTSLLAGDTATTIDSMDLLPATGTIWTGQ